MALYHAMFALCASKSSEHTRRWRRMDLAPPVESAEDRSRSSECRRPAGAHGTGRHREPDPQLAVRRADPPLPVRRRRHHQRGRRERRRASSYFVPIAPPKKKGKQLAVRHRVDRRTASRRTRVVNRIRERVDALAATAATGRHADHAPAARVLDRSRAREEALLLPDRGAGDARSTSPKSRQKYGDAWIENELREANDDVEPGLSAHRAARWRPAAARRSSWRCSSPGRRSTSSPTRRTPASPTRSSSSRPGITIRDRLRVLLPNDPDNYYRAARHRPARPARASSARRKIVITNFHAFKLRETRRRRQADEGDPRAAASRAPFTETPDQMVRRVCRELGSKKNIVVINDEAHHCYRAQARRRGREARRATSARRPRSATRRPASGSPAWRR